MRRSSLVIVYLTVFIDLLGLGLILPILPFYAQSFGANGLLVGATFAVYSAVQLFSSPVLGAWSDRIGRRPVLLLSLAGSALSLALTGLAGSLIVLLFARALSGLFGGAISTAQAYVTDVTKPDERSKYLGMLGAMTGLGFIFGPAMGALLSQYGLSVPAFAAAGLAALNFIAGLFLLPESHHPAKDRTAFPRPLAVARSSDAGNVQRSTFNLQPPSRPARRPFLTPGAIAAALQHPAVGRLFLATMLSTFAFVGVQATFPLFGERTFGLTTSGLGTMFAVVGVISVIVQGGLVGRATKRLGERSVAIGGLVVLALGLALLPLATSFAAALLVMAIQTVGQAFSTPALTSLVSQEADPAERGSLLGLGQSLNALARATGPLLAGWLFDVAIPLPYLAGTLLLMMAVVALRRLPARLPAVATAAEG